MIGETTIGAGTAAASFDVNADAEFLNDQGKEQLDGFELHVAGSVSNFDLELVYQDDFFLTSEDDASVETVEDLDAIYGFVASTTVANAELVLSYHR